ncbi:MAG: hypothetical protein GY756_09380 [bacterium]|nr:hypothetical protein [bacterium]
MKILLFIPIYLFFTVFSSAAILSSTSGGIIEYLPTKGQVIKKGDLLLKLREPLVQYDIAKTKLDIELAQHDLIDKKSDLDRFNKLRNSKIVSAAKYEDMVVYYYIANIKLEKLKIELKELNTKLNNLTIVAPYECVVTNVFLMPNSGVGRGTSILTAKRIVDPENRNKPSKLII